MVQPISRAGGVSLTGQRRHRIGFMKRLVLQVQEKYYLYTWQDHGKPYGDDEWKVRWRDATVNDVSEGAIV